MDVFAKELNAFTLRFLGEGEDFFEDAVGVSESDKQKKGKETRTQEL